MKERVAVSTCVVVGLRLRERVPEAEIRLDSEGLMVGDVLPVLDDENVGGLAE